MPQAEIAQAVRLLDLILDHFADDDHWTRGHYDDGNGRTSRAWQWLRAAAAVRNAVLEALVRRRDDCRCGRDLGGHPALLIAVPARVRNVGRRLHWQHLTLRGEAAQISDITTAPDVRLTGLHD